MEKYLVKYKLSIRKSNQSFRHDFFESQIQEHKKTIAFSDPDASPSDYVEAFLKEQQKLGTIGGNNTFMNSQLKQICFALWLAGQVNIFQKFLN